MDGYLKKNQTNKAMLNRGDRYIIIIITIFWFSCSNNPEEKFRQRSLQVMSLSDQQILYDKLQDTLKLFYKYKLSTYLFLQNGDWYLDNLLCMNNTNDRFISAILYTNKKFPDSKHDGIQCIIGEKIENAWYIMSTYNVHVPREMVKDQPKNKPLTYNQLHQIALKEVFGGYLKPNGEINEDFFTREFEGPDWGVYPETLEDVKKLTRKDFEQRHLQYVKNNWNFVKKDTTRNLQ